MSCNKLLAATRAFEATDDKDKDAEDEEKDKPFPGAAPPFKKKEALVAATRAFEASLDNRVAISDISPEQKKMLILTKQLERLEGKAKRFLDRKDLDLTDSGTRREMREILTKIDDLKTQRSKLLR